MENNTENKAKETVNAVIPKIELVEESPEDVRRVFVRGILKGVSLGTIVFGGLAAGIAYGLNQILKSDDENPEVED